MRIEARQLRHFWRGLAGCLTALALAAPVAAQVTPFPPSGPFGQIQLPGGLPPGLLQGGQLTTAPPQVSVGADNLLPESSPTARAGSTTAAEGGALATGPLGDPFRATGAATAVFGAALFSRRSVSSSDAINPNYVLQPGDRVSISVWGAVEAQTLGVVDPDGNLFLPSIGPIRLAGTRAGDLQRVVEAEVRRIYTAQVQVYAVLLTANRIGVFVTGFVRVPGRYVGSAADSVIDYLSQAGGPDPSRGSFRDIVLRRAGVDTTQIDLYPFLLRGQLPQIRFQDGDTIVVGRQRSLVGVDGAVRNNFLFEVPAGGRLSGRELVDLAAPLPAATNAVLRGTRGGQPWSRYATVREITTLPLQDQDVVSFITDAPAPTIRVTIEGSRLGPSVLVADRDIGLCQLLDYVAVDPGLADTGSVFLLRPTVAAQQRRSINEAIDRLERQMFLALSATTGVQEIRASEAQLVSAYIQRARRVQPDGRLVVASGGRCVDVRLVDGDTIVVPEKSQTVLVSGEVMIPQGVVWRPNLRMIDYINAAGGYSPRGENGGVMIRRASGELLLNSAELPRPGDELIVLPYLDPKYFQITRDILNLIFQSALAVRVFQN